MVNMEEKADEHLRQFHDNAIRRAANMALQAIGNVVEESMKPAFIPKPMGKVAKFAFDGTWPDIRDTLEESIVASKSYAFSGNFSRKALDYWPEKAELWGEAGPWKSWPRHPFRWFKAKFLYAVMPADANAFKHLQDPVAITIILLKLCPYYGINIWLFVIRFFLIDRSDESQLVAFVLGFKGYQLISGLTSTALLCMSFWTCLEENTMNVAVDASCFTHAPGQSMPSYTFTLELVRIILILAAGTLLGGGAAFGGREEILALQHVREQVGNGELDDKIDDKSDHTSLGVFESNSRSPDYQRLKKASKRFTQRRHVRQALAAARIRYGARLGKGGYVPYFMLYYDLPLLLILGTLLAVHVIWLHMHDAPSWLIWTSCFFYKLLWALASWPYVAFIVPVLGEALHQAKPTGYDQSGNLVPQLGSAMIKKKVHLDAQRKAEAQMKEEAERWPSNLHGAATKVQAVYRGKCCRKSRARMMRHFMSLATPVGLFVPASSIEQWFM